MSADLKEFANQLATCMRSPGGAQRSQQTNAAMAISSPGS